MNFNWNEYLNLAYELAEKPKTPTSKEAKLRTAISRSYYAGHMTARKFLLQEGGHFIPNSGEAHSVVIEEFKIHGEITRLQIGVCLERLFIDRKRADYDDTFNGLPESTEQALNLSQKVYDLLGTL